MTEYERFGLVFTKLQQASVETVGKKFITEPSNGKNMKQSLSDLMSALTASSS